MGGVLQAVSVKMRGTPCAFTEEELHDYLELTYCTRKEILRAHWRFAQLDPEAVGRDKNAVLPKEKVMELKQLRVNPFRDRICDVFSSSGDGNISFEDFLNMMSVFNPKAPKALKYEYAFRIYDFDGDELISREDVNIILDRLTGDQKLAEEDKEEWVHKILGEADLDENDSLSYVEFENAISLAPDFLTSFCIRI